MTEPSSSGGKGSSTKRTGRHSRFSLRGATPWAPSTQLPPAQPLPKWASRRYSVSSESLKTALGEELQDFLGHMTLTPGERRIRCSVADRVRQATTELFPESTLEIFGSWSTDLCIPSSDIDFTLCGVDATQAYTLSSFLDKTGFTTHLITNTKVPLIRLTDTASGVHADISFNMKRAAASAKNMNLLLKKHKMARPLIIALKSILKLGNINELYTGGLSSYALSLMVVSYLQHHPFPANDEDAPTTPSEESCDSSSEESEGSRGAAQVDAQSLGRAFLGILTEYGLEHSSLNLEVVTVSVAEGKHIPREESECNSTPGSPISLEDPLDKTNDVARGTFRFVDVRRLFSTVLKILQWYEQYQGLWNAKKVRSYQQPPPPPTPLMSVFSCDPRSWDPMWHQPHPLSWRSGGGGGPLQQPWAPPSHHPHHLTQAVLPGVAAPQSEASPQMGDSLFSRFVTGGEEEEEDEEEEGRASRPVPPQTETFRQKEQSSNSSSSSEGLTRSGPDVASSGGSCTSSEEK